jgi:deoxyribonuclease IV
MNSKNKSQHPVGIHVSISGKIDQCFERAWDLSCRGTFQIFTCSPRRWEAAPLDPLEVSAFRKKLSDSGCEIFVHMPYLPNLSSPDGFFYSKSIQVLQREIKRCSELGLKNLVLHFGSHMGTSIEDGKERIASACNKSIQATTNLDVRLLLENSADPKSVGSSFKTIGEVLQLVKDQERIGVCLDTCHAFASGYDLTSIAAVQKTMKDFDSSIGLSNLYLVHLNDSKGKLGSSLDKHEDIGKGNIGRAGMTAILKSEMLRKIPIILETPRDYEGEDKENIETTKSLADA